MSEFIEFTNEYGQRINMSREDYRTKIIPDMLEAYWNDKEALRQYAAELVRGEFTEEAAKAADRLLELWGPIEPALIFRAIVHMQAKNYDDAKKLLLYTLNEYPSSGVAYTNLAKVFVMQGDEENAFKLLEAGLAVDPNQDNGLDWYVANFLQWDKKEDLLERLKTLADLEGAWRPQLVMGRLALQDGNLLSAMEHFKSALERTGGRADVLMNVTGELGQAGYVYQLIQFAEQYWQPTFENPYPGLNYANALLATDQAAKAVEVVRQMLPHVADTYRPAVEKFLSQLPQEALETQADADAREADGAAEEKKPWWKRW